MVGVKRLINELKLSASSPTTNSTKKLLFTSQDSSDDSSSVDVPKADSIDVCLDTLQFTNMKPVLMQEALVSSTVVQENVEGIVPSSDNVDGNVDASLEKTEQQMTKKETDTDDKVVTYKSEESR